MTRTRFSLLLSLPCVMGCPTTTPPTALTADITLSTAGGPAPLVVMLSSLGSTSAAEITRVTWDFGDGTTDSGATPTHTFNAPGRYRVRLTIEDADGETATAVEDVRVQGGPATAVISASVTSGSAPLGVTFDGTGSSAPDDTILDYFWDFGDGETARVSRPTHVYSASGSYTVTLRAVTGGGVEATATTTITVTSVASASLQFDGSQFATLSVTGGAELTAWTYECWTRPGDSGGQVGSFGTPSVSISLLSSESVVRIVADAIVAEINTPDLTDGWHHLAVTFAEGSVEAYVDGTALGTAALDAAATATNIRIGSGFRGNLYDARLWSVQRSAEDITSGQMSPPSGAAEGLLGNWLLDEGSGQTLANRLDGGPSGVLGASDSIDASDPAWSSDSP